MDPKASVLPTTPQRPTFSLLSVDTVCVVCLDSSRLYLRHTVRHITCRCQCVRIDCEFVHWYCRSSERPSRLASPRVVGAVIWISLCAYLPAVHIYTGHNMSERCRRTYRKPFSSCSCPNDCERPIIIIIIIITMDASLTRSLASASAHNARTIRHVLFTIAVVWTIVMNATINSFAPRINGNSGDRRRRTGQDARPFLRVSADGTDGRSRPPCRGDTSWVTAETRQECSPDLRRHAAIQQQRCRHRLMRGVTRPAGDAGGQLRPIENADTDDFGYPLPSPMRTRLTPISLSRDSGGAKHRRRRRAEASGQTASVNFGGEMELHWGDLRGRYSIQSLQPVRHSSSAHFARTTACDEPSSAPSPPIAVDGPVIGRDSSPHVSKWNETGATVRISGERSVERPSWTGLFSYRAEGDEAVFVDPVFVFQAQLRNKFVCQ